MLNYNMSHMTISHFAFTNAYNFNFYTLPSQFLSFSCMEEKMHRTSFHSLIHGDDTGSIDGERAEDRNL